MRIVLLLSLSFAQLASAAKSEITVVVSNQDGERLAGAEAIFRPWSTREDETARATSNHLGKAVQAIKLPGKKPAGFEIEIKKPGYYSEKIDAIAAPGAKLVTELALTQKFITKLRFIEADGSPSAHRRIVLRSWDTIFTNAEGEFTFSHPPLKEAMGVSFHGQLFQVDQSDANGVKEIRATYILPINSQLSLFNKHQPYPRPSDPVAKLKGRLLQPDGQAASGWLVAQHVTKGLGMHAFGSFIVAGIEHYDFYYRSLSPVDADGGFELSPAFEDLILLSPEGMPFHYPLNPAAWQDKSGLKETLITVPDFEKITVKLRLEAAGGKPAAGYWALPIVSQTYADWTLRPRQSTERPRGYYADSASPPEIRESLSAISVSDKDGQLKVPLHPWGQTSSMALYPPANNHDTDHNGSWNWPSEPLKDGDTIVYKRYNKTTPQKPATLFHDLVCTSLRDSNNKRIDPEQLRWNLYLKDQLSLAGKGGFVEVDGGHQLTLGRGEGRLSFRYRNPRGVMDILSIPFSADNPLPQELAIKLEREPDNPPSLTGRVIDQYGKAAGGIRLHLTDETATDANKKYLQITAMSNQAGRFQFAKAPGTCGVTISAFRNGHYFGLDNAVDFPGITPENRNIEIKMRPTGSVKIKLVDAKALPDHLLLFDAQGESNEGHRHKVVQTDADPFVYVSPYVVPGRYKIAYYSSGFKLIEDLGKLNVEARRETVLELKSPESLKKPPPPPPTYPVRVIVTRNGKPAAGVIVKNDSPQDELYRRHVTSYTGDTTDKAGHAEFVANAGEKLLFATMDHDLHYGWEAIQVEAKENVVEIELESKPDAADEQQAAQARSMFGLPSP